MRSKFTAALAGAALTTLAACASNSAHESQQEGSSTPVEVVESGQDLGLITAAPVAGWDVYGGDVDETTPIAAADLLARAEAFDGQTVVVEGTVDAACTKKGCWMIVKGGDEEMRVRFQDYAFFVPIESAGRTARMEGVFSIVETPEADVKHLLEDAGKHEEAMAHVGSVREFQLMATGVRMRE
ncbi:DUF4920 domain-containing protein [Engelhardtia mirabilis]|uniref:DUF4920 domain-containing protein n=1 Tax=Engelhardtia mirabilis TaxID=2528011 RepID=A0A518BNT6_9BACT|nr:hypothetical protein Pla133_37470 [Planctomycetes bacterium Pla133]QDV02972.1 hypothetical protein Pla86_37460 [Planctomycetes bacterium Pla86]